MNEEQPSIGNTTDETGQPLANERVTALITKLQVTPNVEEGPFRNWLVNMLIAGAQFPGFWSGEILPPKLGARTDWKVIQWYSTAEQAERWKQSATRATILGERTSLFEQDAVSLSDETSLEEHEAGVATAILTEVKPGMESAYWIWEQRIQSAQAKRPGYRGVYLAPPTPGRKEQWTTLLRFDSPTNLDAWFASPERKTLLTESKQFVKATHYQNLSSSFPGWFPSSETGNQIPRWKTAVLVLLGLFPIIVTLRHFLFPLLIGVKTTAIMAVNSMISVSLVTWVAMPVLVRMFRWWLIPQESGNYRKEIAGISLAVCIFVSEIALLWNLLPKFTTR
jgi:antibiotic biosynthesis monooxygenase (ABM) superfamily enzyme